jgi:hypothetical protein
VELKKEKEVLEKELEGLKENDPQALADLEKEFKLVKEAAHRWTDNIFTVSSYDVDGWRAVVYDNDILFHSRKDSDPIHFNLFFCFNSVNLISPKRGECATKKL